MNRLALLLSLCALSLSPMTANPPPPAQLESIVLGGGCFWCTDAAYQLLPGVKHVTCGYAGGTQPNPTYEQVCQHRTDHAEVVKVEFDPAVLPLAAVLDYFWAVHNPTQVGGQGNDHGPQYRSILLYANAAQQAVAEQSRAAAQKIFRDPITTELRPLTQFWPAEDYHQDYFARHPEAGYCQFVIAPKLSKLQSHLPAPRPGPAGAP
ncbi:MAG: peptide-methionine (S)-S-oxide reductase MsrA [Verrucomicrobiota bacterium]